MYRHSLFFALRSAMFVFGGQMWNEKPTLKTPVFRSRLSVLVSKLYVIAIKQV